MICLSYLFAIYSKTMRVLRSGKSLIFTPKWKNVSFRVSEDRARIPCRTESVDSFVVLVSLWSFTIMKRVFSKDPPRLIMRSDFYSIDT